MSGWTKRRKIASSDSGTLSPNPWDLTLSRQNVWCKVEGTRTEDRAPQGCDPSAASRAGMARDGFDAGAVPKTTKQTPPDISLLRAKNGLDNGVHFNLCSRGESGLRQGPLVLAEQGNSPIRTPAVGCPHRHRSVGASQSRNSCAGGARFQPQVDARPEAPCAVLGRSHSRTYFGRRRRRNCER